MSEKRDPKPNASSGAPHKRPVEGVLGRMLDGPSDPEDILALAQALAPLDFSAAGSESLLRRAFTRTGHGLAFSQAQLGALAETSSCGAAGAWEEANHPPLIDWLRHALSSRDGSRVEPWRALAAIGMAPAKALRGAPGREAGSLSSALLDASGDDRLGMAPFAAWARACGQDPVSMLIPASDGRPMRAIAMARSPQAFEMLMASGQDPRADCAGRPLWEAMRDGARSRRDEALFAAADQWAKANEGAAEALRERDAYFAALSRYGGEEKLRSRKDWHEVRDAHGRTAMMALAMQSPASLRAWREVKKAAPAAAAKDSQGRTLWHYFMAKGRSAPSGAAAFLMAHVPLEPDAKGRGLLPSVLAMSDLDGRRPSDHELFMDSRELSRAAWFAPQASQWLACSDPADALAFAHWMANERHVDARHSRNRATEILAELACLLDPLSFCSIHPAVAGALAFSLAIRPSHALSSMDPQRALASLLANGAYVELTADRAAILRERASEPELAMIRAAFGAAEDALAIAAHIGAAGAAAPAAPAKRI